MEQIPTRFQPGETLGVIAIDARRCKGSDTCKRHCATKAITGMFGAVHTIDLDRR